MVATVLLGKRPERPKDPILTNELWVLTQRCLDQDPQRRPEITEVVCDLQEALISRQDRTNVADVARVDDTSSGSTKQREPPRRTPSFIVPFEVKTDRIERITLLDTSSPILAAPHAKKGLS